MEPYWNYEDIGSFFFVLVCLNGVIRLAIRTHLLRSTEVGGGLAMQSLTIIFLGIALYAILKLRYHQPVVAPLGWLLPSRFYTGISILGGVAAALAIACMTHQQGHVMPTIPAKDFFVLGFFLGPILEESVFRGCLLPVLTHNLGSAISVLATAVLFAAFHAPGDITHWVWFTTTGLAYGTLRLVSGTTTAAAFMHAACNLTLFVAAKF
jgi:membrane protease YdiL (CAAX protease family)